MGVAPRGVRALGIVWVGCGGLFGLVWIGLWSTVTLAIDWSCVRSLTAQVRAAKFPSVEGRITQSKVTSRRGSKNSTSYSPEVTYAYAVNGRAYTGTRIHDGTKNSGRSAAEATVATYLAGSTVRVYYDPASPEYAMLQTGVRGTDVFLILFLTPFNVIMVGGWAYAVSNLRKLVPAERRIERRVRWEGTAPVVRLPAAVSPLLAGAIAAAGTAFVLVFVVGFSTAMDPPIAVAVGGLALVAVTGVAAAALAHRRYGGDSVRLAINPVRRTLTLPPGKDDGPRPTTIPFDHVSGIQVDRRDTGSHKNRSIRYAPTLRLRDDPSGRPGRAAAGEFTDEAEAEALAAWLRGQLGLKAGRK
jgi:hypothetical protein